MRHVSLLIVDDSPTDSHLANSIAHRWARAAGVKLHTTVVHSLKAGKNAAFHDVALVDVCLWNGDGRRLAERLRLRGTATIVWTEDAAILLPGDVRKDSAPETLEAALSVAAGCLPRAARPVKLMLVDDDAYDVLQFANTLKACRTPHRFTIAHSAEEALAEHDNGTNPDAVVVDLHLPGMQGDELIQRIQHDPSWGAPTLVQYTADEGCADPEVLLKPTSPEFLERVLVVTALLKTLKGPVLGKAA